ncbi:hypothetical protein AWP91_09105 [Escherichia coli]|nr:hypothetical protein AWP46_22830 [Escherichia coli]OKX43807.1 hypothetical protein AWP91_09105 [Escherichia coli]
MEIKIFVNTQINPLQYWRTIAPILLLSRVFDYLNDRNQTPKRLKKHHKTDVSSTPLLLHMNGTDD